MAQHTTFAPWAEEVPGAPYPMTVDELFRASEQAGAAGQTGQYELVDGRLVHVPGSGGEASLIAVRLTVALSLFVQPRRLGQITGADGTFDLTRPGDAAESALVPDVAYVRADRIPPRGSAEYKRAWRLAPDLLAEVASPNQYRPEMFTKVQRSLAAGVALVWVIWPGSRQVDVWRPPVPTVDQPMVRLALGDALDGLDVLPDFTYTLDELFAWTPDEREVRPLEARMRRVGLSLAVLGTALIVLAVLQVGAFILGESQELAAYLGIAGAVLLVLGAWLSLLGLDGRRRRRRRIRRWRIHVAPNRPACARQDECRRRTDLLHLARRHLPRGVIGRWHLADRWWDRERQSERRYYHVMTADCQVLEISQELTSAGLWVLDVVQD